MSRRIHCFVGPTISASEVTARLPSAQIHPPIAHGDLLRLSPSAGDIVAIIDGYFYERAPIRHKEILGCVEAGTVVAGAASMGALRASELDACGMHGVGTIYRMYRRGSIEADDEVAVLHAGREHHYAGMTEALVNIRASCARARHVRAVAAGDARMVISAAQHLPFHQRSWPEVERAMTTMVGARRAEVVRRRCEGSRVDLKRQDARRLLTWLHNHGCGTPRGDTTFGRNTGRTRFVEDWAHWEIDREPTDHGPIRDIDILSVAQALVPDYPARYLRVMLECYVAGSIDSEAQCSIDTSAIERALGPGGLREAEAERRHLSPHDVVAHFLRKSRVSRVIRGTDAGDDVPIETLEATAWTIAQQTGVLPGGRIPHQVERDWLVAEERELLGIAARAGRIIARSHRASGTLPLRAAAIRDLKVTHDVAALKVAIVQAWDYNRALRARDPRHDAQELSSKPVQEFYLDRWGRAGEPTVATTERGFIDLEDLSRRAGQFMLAARFGGLNLETA